MDQEVSKPSNAQIDVPHGVEEHNTTSHACFSAKSAAGSACVCRLATMETKPFVLATTTGRQRKEDPNALKTITPQFFSLFVLPFLLHFSANPNSFVMNL